VDWGLDENLGPSARDNEVHPHLQGGAQDYEQVVTYRTSVYCLPSKEFTSCTYMAASRLGIPYGLGILPD
jgi:hypothetical protein